MKKISSPDSQFQRRNTMQSGTVSLSATPGAKGITLLLLSPFIILLSLVCIELPWFYALLLNISLALAGLILLKPVNGMYLLLFTVPITSFVCYGAVQADWNFITGMSFIDSVPIYWPLILFTWLGFVMNTWTGNLPGSGMNPLRIPLLILIIYAGSTVFWSASQSHSFFQFITLLFNVLLFSLIVSLIRDTVILKKVLWLWTFSIGFQAIFAILSFFFDSELLSKEILSNFIVGFNFFGSFLQPSGWPQVASGLQDHHETSLLMNMTAPVALGLLLTCTSRSKKYLLFFLLFLMVFITLRTESRSGFGALLIVGAALFLLLRKLRKKLIRLLIFFGISIIVIYTAQQIAVSLIIQKNFTPRLFSLGLKVIETGDAIDPGLENKEHSRKKLWANSFRKYSEVFIQGLGVGNLKKEMAAPHAHSIYFSFWFDFGLVGIFFLLWLALFLIKYLIPSLREQKTQIQIIASSMTGGILAICIQGLVDFEYNTTTIWLYLAMTTAAVNLAEIERQNKTICLK